MEADIIIPIVALSIPIVIAPTAIVAGYLRRSRQLAHAERIRALELGFVPPGSNGPNWPAAFAAATIGAVVPVGVFVVTWLATREQDYSGLIWFAPGVVACSAIESARKIIGRSTDRGRPAPVDLAKPKPEAFDPDAYDVVGARC